MRNSVILCLNIEFMAAIYTDFCFNICANKKQTCDIILILREKELWKQSMEALAL